MSSTLTEKAVVGRRVTLTYFRDLGLADPPVYPGIITGVTDGQATVWVRLDGKRYSVAARAGYEGLRYLDGVVPVPALPMGRFQPSPGDMLGVWEGVPLSTIGEDGEDLILLTDDREKARAAAAAYDAEIGLDLDSVHYEDLRPRWAYFEWQPEDAEIPWFVNWAHEGDDMAIQLYYLPA